MMHGPINLRFSSVDIWEEIVICMLEGSNAHQITHVGFLPAAMKNVHKCETQMDLHKNKAVDTVLPRIYIWLHYTLQTQHTSRRWYTSDIHIVTIDVEPFGAGIYFFNFSTPVYKMLIIQEPNMLELWNKLHFEEEKTESIYHV